MKTKKSKSAAKGNKSTSTAKVYRRKNSRVKSALGFKTPKSKRTKLA